MRALVKTEAQPWRTAGERLHLAGESISSAWQQRDLVVESPASQVDRLVIIRALL